MKIQEAVKQVWICIEKPLKRHNVKMEKCNKTKDYPIKVDVNVFGMAVVEINPETLTNDPNIAWEVTREMEEALQKEYKYVEKQTSYGLSYLKFQIIKEV